MDLESVLGGLVLYKRSLRESETFMSLSKALVRTSKRLDLLVYENTPIADGEVEKIVCENLNIVYKYDASNPGLSEAHNAFFLIPVFFVLFFNSELILTYLGSG